MHGTMNIKYHLLDIRSYVIDCLFTLTISLILHNGLNITKYPRKDGYQSAR